MVPLPWLSPLVKRGLDVSSAQQPNAALMRIAAAAGCVSCDVKACDYSLAHGAPYADPAYLAHLTLAREHGLATGTYAFFQSAAPWQPQAEQYLRTYDASGPLALRPTLDWEDADRIAANPGRALDGALAWGQFVHQRTGRRPTIYTGKNITDILARAHLDASALLAYDLWQAHYRWDPKTGHDYGLAAPHPIYLGATVWPTVAWQCGGNGAPRLATPPDAQGHVEIADVETDIDILYTPTIADFYAWCADEPFQPPVPPTLPALDLTRPKDVQAALVALGYTIGPIDGIFGPKTVGAVRAFQIVHHLTVDGLVGPRTRAALAAALAALTPRS